MGTPPLGGSLAEGLIIGTCGFFSQKSQHVQSLYKTYSDEAERLGVFGAPTYVLNGERFWGQDRLDFLDRALDAEAVGIDAIADHGNPA